MPTIPLDTIAFDGPATTPVAIAIVVAGFVIVALTLFLERRILGRAWAAIFLLLRTVALNAAMWMLLQPSWVETDELTTPKRLVVMADRSASMQTTDDPTRREMRPWVSGQADPLSSLERLEVDLAFAARSLGNVHASVGIYDIAALREQIELAAAAIDRGRQNVKGAVRVVETATARPLSDLSAALDDLFVRIGRLGESEHPESLIESVREALTDVHTLAEGVSAVVARDTVSELKLSNEMPRWKQVSDWLTETESGPFGDLPEDTAVDRFVFDETLLPLPNPNWGSALEQPDTAIVDESYTNLTGAVDGVAATFPTQRPTAVILVSEGQHNAVEVRPPQSAAGVFGDVPIFTVGIGNVDRLRDLVVSRVTAPPTVRINDEAVIEVVVSGFDCDGETAHVELRRGDQLIESASYRFDSDLADGNFQFRIPTDSIGIDEYQVSVAAVSDEQSERNNVSAFSVQVTRAKTRVLLVDSQARWEYRYLQLLFARDDKTLFDEFLLLPKPRLTGEMAALGRLPNTVDEWRRYDVVILGDLPAEALPPEGQLALSEHVRTGGRVIVIAGRNHMPAEYVDQPLFSALPVRSQPIQVEPRAKIDVTPEGQLHAAMQIDIDPASSLLAWERIFRVVPVDDTSPWSMPRDSAHVLGRLVTDENANQAPDTRPAWLCWHRYGDGLVAYLSSATAYHLRFRTGDRYHHRFWGQLLRWSLAADLSGGNSLVKIQADKSRYSVGETVGIAVEMADAAGTPVRGSDVEIQLEDLDGQTRTVRLVEDERIGGLYRTSVDRLDAGVYVIRPIGEGIETLLAGADPDVSVQAVVTIEQPMSLERTITSANPTLLEEISAATGGQLISPRALGEVLALLPFEADRQTIETRTPIWDRWSLLWLIFGCLAIEWIIRRRKGLI